MSKDEERLLAGLRKTVERVLRLPYYQQSLGRVGVKQASDIRTLGDFQRLPLTSKEDLRLNYPFGLFAEPPERIVRLHASSGTTGKPTVVGYTENDIKLWSGIVAESLARAGIGKGDVIQVAYGYGLFTGGMGLHYGSEKLGAMTVPISGGNTRRQLMLMRDFGTTVLACTPSYALYLGESLGEAGISRQELRLKKGVLGAEPWTEGMREEIEARLGIDAYDIYGLSEIMGPGVAMECPQHRGLHIDGHFYPEILDERGEPLPEGVPGELVFTSIDKEAFPVLRYRTKDLTALHHGDCGCGHSGWTMERVTARVDDMLIIRGVNVFPSQIEEGILAVDGLEPHYLLIVERAGTLDQLEVQVEVNAANFIDEVRELETLKKRVQQRIEEIIGISIRVRLVEPKSIPRSEGKAKRVVDKRKG
ncbi:phenylacetate-CoA ligase [Acididesulfobacillus acetoxydans]|uniref:Phenylacetate-coenzyme A ligase n=1 Tax=Acididesulfobacillus acetoxydans TaxID=1561005 RepID=A0A8S0XCR7_9FIRM|nr:phenylacetate--CoA ligase [Acididesulfobacillus acetoxydans]CAA7602766.1 phenylacetate-CoA ligase [Acididesulfobacillus acetoxydans]CEJ06377.1 Phenylacetate-coenzyme A ligase [Acididesulfobacillus acetoxydans]